MKFYNFNYKKVFVLLVLLLLVCTIVGGGWYFLNKITKDKNSTTIGNTETEKQIEQNLKTKEDASKQSSTPNTESSKISDTPYLSLDDIVLQAVLTETKEISISLYGISGEYRIQRQANGVWINVVDSATYSGRGGFEITEKIPANEDSRAYRIYRKINNNFVGPKDITVLRSLVVEKGGITNF